MSYKYGRYRKGGMDDSWALSFSFSFSLSPVVCLQSPADRTCKVHAGDEVIQVNRQTVVSTPACHPYSPITQAALHWVTPPSILSHTPNPHPHHSSKWHFNKKFMSSYHMEYRKNKDFQITHSRYLFGTL